MQTTTHTCSPWYAKEGMIASESDPSGRTIATCDDETDARLIAAAPELLRALKGILDGGGSPNWVDVARAVIAKAEGAA